MCGRRHHAGHLQDKRDHPSTATKGTCKSILPTPTREKFPSPQSTGLIIPCPKSALKDLIFANSRNWIYIYMGFSSSSSFPQVGLSHHGRFMVSWNTVKKLSNNLFLNVFLCKDVKNIKKYWNPTMGFFRQTKKGEKIRLIGSPILLLHSYKSHFLQYFGILASNKYEIHCH